jgi:hypothetical protein
MNKFSFKTWYEMMTGYTGAIVGSCKGGPDFQVQGACTDLKRRKKKNEQCLVTNDAKSQESCTKKVHDSGHGK